MTAVDPDEARRLLERELQRSEYGGAHATWWDRASKGFLDWLGSLRADGLDSPAFGHTVLWIGVVVLIAVVVLVVLARGLPRRRVRVGDGDHGVFDAGDLRTAADLLRSAEAALRAGDWDTAVLDGYRATARGLGERDLVPDVPGATARAIANRAGSSFPDAATELGDAATAFDAVRYLGHPADRSTAESVLATERSVRRARPASAPAVPA